MRTRIKLAVGLASLGAVSCVLPEHGGGTVSVGGVPNSSGSSSGGSIGSVSTIEWQVGGSLSAGGAAQGQGGSLSLGTGGTVGADGTGGTSGTGGTGGTCTTTSVADPNCPCGTGGASSKPCSQGEYLVNGVCAAPMIGGNNLVSIIQGDAVADYYYDDKLAAYRMNRNPKTIIAQRLDEQYLPGTKLLSMGAVTDADPRDPNPGKFRLAVYSSNAQTGLPEQFVAQTTHDLASNEPEEVLTSSVTLDGGTYWLLMWVDGPATVHLEASNQLIRRGLLVDPNAEIQWPQGEAWAHSLIAWAPPAVNGYLGIQPHMFIRYLRPSNP